MASFIESKVAVNLRLIRDETGDHIMGDARTFTSDGTPIRQVYDINLGPVASQAQKDDAKALLDALEAYAKSQFQIA